MIRLASLLCALLLLHPAAASPRILWASDPVKPDETVLVLGADFQPGCRIELARLADAIPTMPAAPITGFPGTWEPLIPASNGARSLSFVIPKSQAPGVWACRIRQGENDVSEPVLLNAPAPWWWNGDQGATASPGGWVRVFGKCLAGNDTSRGLLRSQDGHALALSAVESSDYALRFNLPGDLHPGDYEMFVHNGFGGDSAWRSVGLATIRVPEPWPTEVFNVRDFGPRPGDAVVAALKKAEASGGGIVFLPRGRYPVSGTLTLPPRTILRGESMELVSLYWPDFDDPPKELVSGGDCGIESLTLYCQHHRNVVADAPNSNRFFALHIRIRANCFFMIEDVGKEFRKRHGPASHKECGAAVLLRGNNFEIADCDIYASNYALRILKGKAGLVARNRLLYGGRGYSLENTDRLIFEDNLVSGNNLLAIGNDITTFWTNSCKHIFYARNHVQQMYGADREMMTLDAAGGAYFGKVAATEGCRLTLASDPVFRDYAPKPHTDWTGATVQILDGRGAGQYRFVASHAGREWNLDRPWLVPPDESSVISIAPFRGQNLFIGNNFEDGGAFQLYGAAHDSIVAGNKGSRMDGFLIWGLNPHGWGHQPSWFCQFLDNEILEGNGYGHRSASFGTVASDESQTFDGPMVRATILRRNTLHNNARIVISKGTEDSLIEHCTLRHNDAGIVIKPGAHGVLLRENQFEDIARPIEEPAR